MDVDGLAQVDVHHRLGVGIVAGDGALCLPHLCPPRVLRLRHEGLMVSQLDDDEGQLWLLE